MALSNTDPAPDARALARELGHPSLGFTNRKLLSPKFNIALAEDPIVSPSWGRTRIKIGSNNISFDNRKQN